MTVASRYFQVEQVEDVTVIRLTTDTIDSMNLDQVLQELAEHVETQSPRKLLLNLAAVAYFHSIALGRLAALHLKMKKTGAELRLCNLQPAVYQVFIVTQLDKLLDVRSFEQTALKGWAGGPDDLIPQHDVPDNDQ